jgi:predicted RNA-binding protein (TIGR00451 family)
MQELEALASRFKFSLDTLSELERIYGEHVAEVVQSLKSPGRHYYFRVNTLKATVDCVVKRFEERNLRVHVHPLIEEALYFEVEKSQSVERFEKKVVVDKFTAESVLQGAHVYAPGIVKCQGLRIGNKVSIVDDQGQTVGAGIARMNESSILALRRGLAIEVTFPLYRIPSLRETSEYEQGLVYPQSLPAILTSRILSPQAGETIVDFTCSPGGKLSHIGQLTKGRARIIGVDRNETKISSARETIRRMGCNEVALITHDARYLDVDFPGLVADRCLVDPPCSALGVKPKTYEYTSREEIEALATYQRQFLKAASKMLRPGGILVYSVCTVTLSECEGNVKFAVDECGLEVEAQDLMLGSAGIDTLLREGKLTQRFHPHLHDSGYFIAKFRKKG